MMQPPYNTFSVTLNLSQEAIEKQCANYKKAMEADMTTLQAHIEDDEIYEVATGPRKEVVDMAALMLINSINRLEPTDVSTTEKTNIIIDIIHELSALIPD